MCLMQLTMAAAALSLSGVAAVMPPYLYVTYSVWGGYFSVPMSRGGVDKGSEYVFAGHDEDLNVDLFSYPGDPRFFILFASNGYIAGLRFGYIKEDVPKRAKSHNFHFPDYFERQPMYISGTYWNTSLWHTTVLFMNPESLRSGDVPGPTEADVDLYLPLDGRWTMIPKDQCKAEALGFTKQSCFIGMGMHYFYKMRKEIDCADLPGVFTLYENGLLVGLGIIPFGSFTSKKRTWFEDPPSSIVKVIVPNHPDCLTDWVNNYGTSSIHIFFKQYPRLTFCTWPWQNSDQCAK